MIVGSVSPLLSIVGELKSLYKSKRLSHGVSGSESSDCEVLVGVILVVEDAVDVASISVVDDDASEIIGCVVELPMIADSVVDVVVVVVVVFL